MPNLAASVRLQRSGGKGHKQLFFLGFKGYQLPISYWHFNLLRSGYVQGAWLEKNAVVFDSLLLGILF